MYKNNADTVILRPISGDVMTANRSVDRRVEGRAVTDYGTISPLLTAKEIFPRLSRWFEVFKPGDERHATFAGSIGLEAAIGAPNHKMRKTLLGRARQRISDTRLDDTEIPSDPLIRKIRTLDVIALMATRSLTSADYRMRQLDLLGKLETSRQHVQAANINHGNAQRLSGAVLEQTVLCLLHDPANGMVAVPSFMRQDENDWREGGKKYRWDVTVESDGRLVPEGQYWFQAKNNAGAGLQGYHPDIIIASGPEHLGSDYVAGNLHPTAAALLDGNTGIAGKSQYALFEAMVDHGPSSSVLQYFE